MTTSTLGIVQELKPHFEAIVGAFDKLDCETSGEQEHDILSQIFELMKPLVKYLDLELPWNDDTGKVRGVIVLANQTAVADYLILTRSGPEVWTVAKESGIARKYNIGELYSFKDYVYAALKIFGTEVILTGLTEIIVGAVKKLQKRTEALEKRDEVLKKIQALLKSVRSE